MTERIPWVGVDPGARQTGIVRRVGQELLDYVVVDRADVEPAAVRPGRATFAAVADAVLALAAGGPVAIESLRGPSPHVRRQDGNSLINPITLIDTARLVGYLEAMLPDAVLIEPGGHGNRPLGSYPAQLVTPRERASALRRGGLLRPAAHNEPQCHWRAAWDVAEAGRVYALVDRGRQRAARTEERITPVAKKVITVRTDDLDGTEADEYLQFAVGGTVYEIDLSAAHAAEFRAALAPWVGAARPWTPRRARQAMQEARNGNGKPRTSASRAGSAAARAWALANGYQVTARGRLSREVWAAYEAAGSPA